MAEKEQYLNKQRTSELWTTIKTYVSQELEDYATHEGVATAIVTALRNYPDNDALANAITEALSDYMKASDVNEAIASAVGDIITISYEVVDRLPQEGKDKTIYLTPSEDAEDKNVKDEWLWVNGEFEKIGSTKADMTGYWSKDELTAISSEELKAILV